MMRMAVPYETVGRTRQKSRTRRALVEATRDLLYDLQMPSLRVIAYLVVVSVGTFAAGLAIFRRAEGRLAEEL